MVFQKMKDYVITLQKLKTFGKFFVYQLRDVILTNWGLNKILNVLH